MGLIPRNEDGLLWLIVKQSTRLIGRGLEQLPGAAPFAGWKFPYPELWLHGVTTVVLLVCFLFAHGLIFSIVRRKIYKRE